MEPRLKQTFPGQSLSRQTRALKLGVFGNKVCSRNLCGVYRTIWWNYSKHADDLAHKYYNIANTIN